MIPLELAILPIGTPVALTDTKGRRRRGRIVTYRVLRDGRVFAVKMEDGEIIAGLAAARLKVVQ